MIGKAGPLIKETAYGFLADEALTRGAAIAYYTIFSIAPLLIIVIAIAGLAFGRDAAEGAIVGQVSGLMGEQSAALLESMITSANNWESGVLATIIGIGTLLLTATGTFAEIQSALNAIWKARPSANPSDIVRARLLSLGLVVTLGSHPRDASQPRLSTRGVLSRSKAEPSGKVTPPGECLGWRCQRLQCRRADWADTRNTHQASYRQILSCALA
jgi:Virulence factor BrkB